MDVEFAKDLCRSGLPIPPQPFRLGILVTDQNPVRMIKVKGGYPWAFQELFRRGCDVLWPGVALSKLFLFPEYDVTDERVKYPTCDEVDGVLLTGSKASASEDTRWINNLVEFVDKHVYNAPPTNHLSAIGVCFGHQVIGRALGLGVEPNRKGWEVSATKIDLSEEGKKVFGLEKMHLHQMHQDIVIDSPRLPVKSLGSTAICTNQIFSKSNRLLSVQGHPEFTNAMVAEILKMRHNRGVLSVAAFKEAMRRVDTPHDGDVVGVAFILFLYLPWLKKVMPDDWAMPRPWCDFHAFDEPEDGP